MWTSATVTRILFSFLFLNLALVVTVAVLRPVSAQQQSEDAANPKPEVQVPSDPPSLPTQSDKSATEPIVAMPELTAPAPAAPANKMVLDEILKVIQDGRGELDVPPLDYPALPIKANAAKKPELQQLSQRMKSIAHLTQSAQTLIIEAQQLHSAGQAQAAQALTDHVQTLRSIIVELAAGSDTN